MRSICRCDRQKEVLDKATTRYRLPASGPGPSSPEGIQGGRDVPTNHSDVYVDIIIIDHDYWVRSGMPAERRHEQKAGLPDSSDIWPIWLRYNTGPEAVGAVHWRFPRGSLRHRFPGHFRPNQSGGWDTSFTAAHRFPFFGNHIHVRQGYQA